MDTCAGLDLCILVFQLLAREICLNKLSVNESSMREDARITLLVLKHVRCNDFCSITSMITTC